MIGMGGEGGELVSVGRSFLDGEGSEVGRSCGCIAAAGATAAVAVLGWCAEAVRRHGGRSG